MSTTTIEKESAAAAIEFPKATEEHGWLQQFIGEWESEAECFCDPDGPPMINKGTEKIRALGDFWIVSEIKSDADSSFPFASLMMIGYDQEKGKYVGTWADTMSGFMFKYEGSVSDDGKKLTLETEGFCPMNPGVLTKFREELELKSPDHKFFTSSIQGEDGEWRIGVRSNAYRKA